MKYGVLEATLSGISSLKAVLNSVGTISAELIVSSVIQTNPFTGDYEYTPSNEVQTIKINGLRAVQDIVIDPIPNNYGLITWNGSTITVS